VLGCSWFASLGTSIGSSWQLTKQRANKNRQSLAKCFGVWCLVFGVWCLVFGVWCLVFGVSYLLNFKGI